MKVARGIASRSSRPARSAYFAWVCMEPHLPYVGRAAVVRSTCASRLTCAAADEGAIECSLRSQLLTALAAELGR